MGQIRISESLFRVNNKYQSHNNENKNVKQSLILETAARLPTDLIQHILNFSTSTGYSTCIGIYRCNSGKGEIILQVLPDLRIFRFGIHIMPSDDSRFQDDFPGKLGILGYAGKGFVEMLHKSGQALR